MEPATVRVGKLMRYRCATPAQKVRKDNYGLAVVNLVRVFPVIRR